MSGLLETEKSGFSVVPAARSDDTVLVVIPSVSDVVRHNILSSNWQWRRSFSGNGNVSPTPEGTFSPQCLSCVFFSKEDLNHETFQHQSGKSSSGISFSKIVEAPS